MTPVKFVDGGMRQRKIGASHDGIIFLLLSVWFLSHVGFHGEETVPMPQTQLEIPR